MGLFTGNEDQSMLQCIEEVKEQKKLNIDEYTKFKKSLTLIQSFYAGKSIFVTGATGFLGISFVEKVLRDCSDIKKLYVLVRPGKSSSVEAKMKKYFGNVVFDRLRKINPNFEEKIVTVNGDLGEKNLGLSNEDRQLLIDNIDIMIHNGATVNFYESIDVALRINVLGTKEMLELALACKNMKAFTYVSTAYSHSYRKRIKEEFYDTPADLKMVHDMIAADQATKLSKETVNTCIGKWENVYTFTKSIAEDLVRQYGEKANFSCSIFRPSMITPANKEPLIGWIGNKKGPNLMFLGIGLGAAHLLWATGEPLDVVPVDYSTNALISSVYDAARQWKYEKRPRVYNFGSSMANAVTVTRIYSRACAIVSTIGTETAVWHISAISLSNKLLFFILHIFLHCIPALFADVGLLIMGKKPRAVSICIAATKNMHWLLHFMGFGWRIEVTEMRKVFDAISEEDRKLFDFDIWNLKWDSYLNKLFIGLKVFLLKESVDDMKKAKRHATLLRAIHLTFLTVFYLCIAYYIMKLFGVIN